jgi:hypothetical protein
MSLVKTSQIEVFPVAKLRATEAPGTRILTERNISNLTRQLLSDEKTGYIISCNPVGNKKFNISFNLYGYYFNITDLDLSTFSGGNDIYASIVIKDEEIFGQDKEYEEQSFYEGLVLTSGEPAEPVEGELHYIKLFRKVGSKWEVATENFGLVSALFIGGIDGKHT